MKKSLQQCALFFRILLYTPGAAAAELLIPVGQVVALELENDCVTVAAFEGDGCGELQVGDEIQTIDGRTIDSPADVRAALEASDGAVEVEILRGKEQLCIELTPKITADGPRLGVFLRQGVTGIGTVTYYDPDTETFAALGHGVNTPDGQTVDMKKGFVYAARVLSVRRGKVGQPGQLMGALAAPEPMGKLSDNTLMGVFGTCGGWKGQPIHRQGRDATGVFCGDPENLSQFRQGGQKHAHQSHRPRPAPSHRRHRTGHERLADHTGRQAHRCCDPCSCQRSHHGVWNFH